MKEVLLCAAVAAFAVAVSIMACCKVSGDISREEEKEDGGDSND